MLVGEPPELGLVVSRLLARLQLVALHGEQVTLLPGSGQPVLEVFHLSWVSSGGSLLPQLLCVGHELALELLVLGLALVVLTHHSIIQDGSLVGDGRDGLLHVE